jgi:hypothetical protein
MTRGLLLAKNYFSDSFSGFEFQVSEVMDFTGTRKPPILLARAFRNCHPDGYKSH